MGTYALGVEYNGENFSGWQKQLDRPTIQGSLEKALSQVADSEIQLSAAGRTDAGVHAMGQVASFQSAVTRSSEQWRRGVNSLTPDSINVAWVTGVEDDFHARFSATARRYLYLFMDRVEDTHAKQLAWSVASLNADLMHASAQFLVGEHDFTTFRGSGCQAETPYRRINHCVVKRIGDLVVVDIEANAFLLHMVRNIVSCLSQIKEDSHPDYLLELLSLRDRTQIGMTAPSSGLYLFDVRYPDYDFPLPRLPSLLLGASREFSIRNEK